MSLQTNPPSPEQSGPLSKPATPAQTSAKKAAKGPQAPYNAGWFVTYAKPLLWVLGALIMVAGVWSFVSYQNDKNSAAARDSLYKAKQILEQEMKVLAPPKSADAAETADE